NCTGSYSGIFGTCSYTNSVDYYTCTYPDGSPSGSTCTHNYTATANYTWTAQPPAGQPQVVEYSSATNVPAAYTMKACFNRTYDLVPQDGSVPGATFNPENPKSVQYNGSIDATFSETDDGPGGKNLRVDSQVSGIKATITVKVFHQNNLGNVAEAVGESPDGQTKVTTLSFGPYGTTPVATGSQGVSWTLPVSLPPLKYGDTVCFNLSTDPSHGQISANNPWGSVVTTVGQRDQMPPVTAANVQAGSITSCSPYTNAEPYLKVFGGDVTAGTETKLPAGSCTDTSAPINAWNNPDYSGAGTQLAAFAAGAISGFASAQNVPGSSPTKLSFASGGTYGGNFGASSNDCATNYYLGASSASGPPFGGGSLPHGNQTLTYGGGTIHASTLMPGDNIVIYSSGPVNIDGDITYSPGAVSSDLSKIPNLEIITNGQPINIEGGVKNLAGNYVAENAVINDCSGVAPTHWFYDPDNDTALANTCGQKLTLDGSFTAQNLVLARTGADNFGNPSTIHLANPGESPGANYAAEEFDYSPAVWLTYPNVQKPPDVQAITSFPPIL
ncbi:MAG: hypothetical protein ACREGF_00955, partial [Candidatus Saccharimonadales bacterium]